MNKITYLPAPTLEPWRWRDKAACKDMGTAAFFHPDGERGDAKRRRAAAAKAICAGYPVLEQCRSYALAAHEPYGIQGGMTEEEHAAYWKSQEAKTA